MIGGMGLCTPKFIKEVEIVNNYHLPHTAFATFESGEHQQFTIHAHQTGKVFRETHQGLSTHVDPVTGLGLKVENGGLIIPVNVSNPNGIEIRKVVIDAQGAIHN